MKGQKNMNIIYNSKCFDTAATVYDYPWGYTLKTQRKYWVETVPKKGDRVCYQTLNPKTNKWCKVKKGTYSNVAVLTSKNGYISNIQISNYDGWKGFLDTDIDYEKLNNEQKKKLCELKAIDEVMKNVKVEYKINQPRSEEEEKKQEEIKDNILGAINYKINACYKQQKLI